MKKDLLSSIIIAMLMTAGLSACDEKKADEQPVAQSADSSSSNTQPTSAESADANDVLNQKLNVYIDCYNNLQADIYRAVNRYAKEGANKRGNSSRLTQSFHFFMFEPIFSPVNALNQPI